MVKLDELHVGDRRACAVGHYHAVTGGDVRVGGVEVNLAAAAGGEDDRPCRVGLDCIGLIVQHVHADAAIGVALAKLAGSDQVDREVVFKNVNVFIRSYGLEQGALDLAAGDVLGVQDAPLGVASLAAEIKFAFAIAIFALGKFHSEFDQLHDALRAGLDNAANDLLVAQSRTGNQRVLHVALERILLACHCGDAALRVVGVRFRPAFFRDDGNRPGVGHLECERQPGDPAAEDDVIKLSW